MNPVTSSGGLTSPTGGSTHRGRWRWQRRRYPRLTPTLIEPAEAELRHFPHPDRAWRLSARRVTTDGPTPVAHLAHKETLTAIPRSRSRKSRPRSSKITVRAQHTRNRHGPLAVGDIVSGLARPRCGHALGRIGQAGFRHALTPEPDRSSWRPADEPRRIAVNLGCSRDRGTAPGMIAIDVPPAADIRALFAAFTLGRAQVLGLRCGVLRGAPRTTRR